MSGLETELDAVFAIVEICLLYITGAPGVGKSTLQEKLISMGYETYDVDDPLFGDTHNLTTGEKVDIPPVDKRASDWFDRHEWRVYVEAFEKLQAEARDRDIFVLGVSSNDDQVLHVFDKIVYLEIDEDTLVGRIQRRIDNDYGKSEHELADILARKRDLDVKYNAPGIILLDAKGSIKQVVDRLLANAI